MSLDITLTAVRPTSVWDGNITHNLNKMAAAVGIYDAMWHPDRIGATHAAQIIGRLREGLEMLKSDPEHYSTFEPSNKWGTYADLVKFVEEYLAACEENPDAEIVAYR